MNSFIRFVKTMWGELDSAVELCVYLSIAYGIEKIFGVTYMQGIGIVFIFFVMNLLRVAVEIIRNNNK